MGSRMTTDLVQRALKKALRFRTPLPGGIHHSDRGSQYCAAEYRKDVESAGMIASMTRNEAIAAIREYIEIFYNRMRRHSALGNTAPSVFAEAYYSQRRVA
jgi:putative transposase